MSIFHRPTEQKLPTDLSPRLDNSPITLDPSQKLAVETNFPRVLVLAGAGSGKTRVLTERVKYLLSTGVSPSNIIAITFTNMAAEEMKQRLKDIDCIGDCFIGTIHSFANKIMGMTGENFKIFNDNIDLDFHKELIEKYCKFLELKKYLAYKDLCDAVERGEASENEMNNFLLPSEGAELHYIERTTRTFDDETMAKNYPETIQSLCKERGVITFDELLKKATDYFNSINAHPEHVLVDEFQDVGPLESNFLKSLDAENYFYVGDDYQAIYGFKGGNVKLFKSLYKSSHWKNYYLENNYRNPQSIVDLGEKIMSQVTGRIPHNTKCLSDVDCSINVLSRYKGKQYLLNSLKHLKEDEYRETFVLTRSNKELFELKQLLDMNGIPNSTFKREGMTLTDISYIMDLPTVKVITVHTAKGLEADNVHLWGNFPLTVPSYLRNDEERRVMYVGVTRARKSLTIYN